MVAIHKWPHKTPRNRSAFRACRTTNAIIAVGAIILACIVMNLYSFSYLRNDDDEDSRTIHLDNDKDIHLKHSSEKKGSKIESLLVSAEKDTGTVSTPSKKVARIHVVTVNRHNFGSNYEREVPNCKYKEELMECVYTKANEEKADVLLYHMPNAKNKIIERQYPDQLLAGMSMEPSTYFQHQMDPKFLSKFDIRMYYNRMSEVPLLFSNAWLDKMQIFEPIKVKSTDKVPALVYINSNCAAKNGRNDIVKGVMDIGDVDVHSYGICLRNKIGENGFHKVDVMAKYKFCIAIENSNEIDYISEKLWQALEAGCLPVYWGAPNIAEHLPVALNKIIINYADFGSPKALSDEILRINNDDKLYEEFFEWKKLDPHKDKVLPGFKWVLEVAERGHAKCELCKYAMKIFDNRTNVT